MLCCRHRAYIEVDGKFSHGLHKFCIRPQAAKRGPILMRKSDPLETVLGRQKALDCGHRRAGLTRCTNTSRNSWIDEGAMSLPRINRVGSATIAVGLVAFSISVLSSVLYISAIPSTNFSYIALLFSLAHPTINLVLCICSALFRRLSLELLFFLVSLMTVPMFLDRHGGGVTDASEYVKITSARLTYSGQVLMDVSTVLWIICAVSTLIWVRKPLQSAGATD